MQLKEELIYLGLTKQQSAVYIWLLENGSAKITHLAKMVGYSRPTIYNILSELKKMGLITENLGGQSTFSAQAPSKLVSFLQEKDREIERRYDEEKNSQNKKKQYLDELMSKLVLAHSKAPSNPKVRFFEGESGIEKIREEILSEHLDEDSYEVFNYDSRKKGNKQDEWQEELNKGKSKHIFLCTSKKIDSEQIKNIDNKEFNIIPAKDNPFFTEIMTYDYKTIITSLKKTEDDNVFGIIIEDKNITETIKNLIKQYLNK